MRSTSSLTPEAPTAASADPLPNDQQILPSVLYAFAPLHKRAFGAATGTAAAVLMTLLSLAWLLLPNAQQFPLFLLSEYFAGYERSWLGVLVGASWGFVVGFVGGWFGAFCRNVALAVSAFVIRTRAELSETRDFLDHI
jgi:hypothetical protein